MATRSSNSCLENRIDRGAWRSTVCGVMSDAKSLKLFVDAYLHLRTGGCGPALGPSLSQLTIPSHPVERGSCSCSPAAFKIRFRSVGLFRLSPLSPARVVWGTSLWGNAESRHGVVEATRHVLVSALLLNCFSVKTAFLWKELIFLAFLFGVFF